MTATISVSRIRKAYGGNLVLDGVDLKFQPGKIHALLGPNGAGKSTLLGCISGAIAPDSGEIRIGETSYSEFTPAGAFAAGTAIIYQHFQLVGSLSVADNIFLGSELRGRNGVLRSREQRRIATELLAELGADFDVATPVERLSVGQQQLVEIARALRHKPSLLVLDEPTAALSSAEVTALLTLVRRLAHERGLAIIYVTHLLREVLDVSDEVSVLRDGRVLWTRHIADLTMTDLVLAISPTASGAGPRGTPKLGTSILRLSGLECDFTRGVDLEVRGGEVVAVFGLLGSGRTDLLETVCGLRKHARGEIQLAGTPCGSRAREDVAYVPADRKAHALFGAMSAEENLLMPHYSRLGSPLRDRGAERRIFAELAANVSLRPADPHRPVEQFSGGNAQKISVGRWLVDRDRIKVLVLDEPTQGVDVGSRAELYALVRDFAESGDRAVLFATSDPDEVVALADRVLVLAHGRPVGIFPSTTGESRLIELAHADALTPASAAHPALA